MWKVLAVDEKASGWVCPAGANHYQLAPLVSITLSLTLCPTALLLPRLLKINRSCKLKSRLNYLGPVGKRNRLINGAT